MRVMKSRRQRKLELVFFSLECEQRNRAVEETVWNDVAGCTVDRSSFLVDWQVTQKVQSFIFCLPTLVEEMPTLNEASYSILPE